MIARGQFHIQLKDLFCSFLNLFTSKLNSHKNVFKFSDQLKNHLGAKDVKVFSSCRIAFSEFLRNQNFEQGSEVLLCPITIPDMVNAIIINGLKPVFVDMNLSNHSFDIEDLENKITEKSCLILNTNLSGLNNLNTKINELAAENELILVDDISQAPVRNYFQSRGAADFTFISLSIGKTITTLVGGAIASKGELIEGQFKIIGIAKRAYFLRQLLENIKIDILTSPLFYKYFTRFSLAVLAKISPSKYMNIHQTNTITKFNEEDIFFDDIPVLRETFPEELYFPFNDWMADLGMRTLNKWKNVDEKRRRNRDIFIEYSSEATKRCVAQNFLREAYFPTRVPLYITNVERFSLFVISKGLDMGRYGLNLCSEEKVFSHFSKNLPSGRFIKENCLFLNLSEKNNEYDLVTSIEILNKYFEAYSNENT
ncbi:putative aminotransferase [Halobacteriovorax marinus SJ]|uniref:Aminotransferase n=1 Tax=Halobacteriovorax marinus (strain ATCC BAA-682 / DSM 15412 / SJ) TaxID=862908 RepID=E1WZU4_HALMS|nr:putative aminotransferase [Halobacteriovorax marinus SJ]